MPNCSVSTFSDRDGAMRNTVVSGPTNTQHHQRWLSLPSTAANTLQLVSSTREVRGGGVPLGDQPGQRGQQLRARREHPGQGALGDVEPVPKDTRLDRGTRRPDARVGPPASRL